MTNEIWKEIPDCEGFFASNLGRIKGPRTVYKGHIDAKGYIRMSVIENGKRVYRNSARLVARAFHGHSDQMVLHINGRPADNRPENLRYGSTKENYEDSRIHGTNPKGKTHGRTILSEAEILEIRRLYNPRVLGYAKLAKMFGIGRTTARLIVKRMIWAHLQNHEAGQ